MNKSSIQGFAAGIIFTVAIIGVYTFWSNENEGSSHLKSDEEQNQKTSVDENQVKDDVISYQLSIQAGMITNEIASILLEQNILKETDSFTKYMNDQNLNNKI